VQSLLIPYFLSEKDTKMLRWFYFEGLQREYLTINKQTATKLFFILKENKKNIYSEELYAIWLLEYLYNDKDKAKNLVEIIRNSESFKKSKPCPYKTINTKNKWNSYVEFVGVVYHGPEEWTAEFTSNAAKKWRNN